MVFNPENPQILRIMIQTIKRVHNRFMRNFSYLKITKGIYESIKNIDHWISRIASTWTG